MTNKLKIGVTGPISEVNFGDYAMFVNNFYNIDSERITIFSYNKGFSQKIVGDYLFGKNINNIEIKLKDEDMEGNETKKVGFLPFNHPTDTPLDILYRVENLDEIREAVSQIDIMIVNGGGYFNHLWNNSLWRSEMLKKIIAPILVASQMNKEIYFTGNGFGPFEQSEEFFYYIFNYLKKTTFAVRDRMYSKKYLEKIGISSKKIQFIPDDLYFINNKLSNLPLCDASRLQNIGKYILMELYYPLEKIKEYEERLKKFSDSIYKKYGLSIIFVPFDFERGGTWQGEFLSEKLDNFYLYDLNVSGYLPVQDIYKLIQNAEMVICNRYHALVLSVSLKTPVVNVIKKVLNDHRYYFNKNYGLLEYAFDGLIFNEMDFIHISLDETLNYVEENFNSILSIQKKLYSSKEYQNNKYKLKEIRDNYFDLIQGDVVND